MKLVYRTLHLRWWYGDSEVPPFINTLSPNEMHHRQLILAILVNKTHHLFTYNNGQFVSPKLIMLR
jgi:hypothetical protein